MTAYLFRRIAQMVLVVLGTTFVVFFVMQVLGDPIKMLFPLGVSQDVIDKVRDQYGFNDPIFEQYGRFLAHAVRGDFGDSVWQHRPALQAALDALPKTLMLVLPAAAIGVGLGAIAGVLAGLRAGSLRDRVIGSTSYLAISIAEFWFALMLIYIFGGKLGIVATGGYATDFEHMALPILVLTVLPFAHTAQVTRASVIAQSRMAYTLTARAKGVSDRRVAFRHVLPNAVIPVMTVAIYDLSIIIFSSATIEVVFAWPGIGRLTFDALSRGDIFLVEAVIVLGAVVIVGFNIVADLITFRLDPRTRSVLEEGGR